MDLCLKTFHDEKKWHAIIIDTACSKPNCASRRVITIIYENTTIGIVNIQWNLIMLSRVVEEPAEIPEDA
jgi:hypothetical protein